MTKNPHRLPEKERREMRRRNHIARDLMTPKYRTRTIIEKDLDDNDWKSDLDEWYNEGGSGEADPFEGELDRE